MARLIDTHCHLTFNPLFKKIDEIIDDKNLLMISVGTNIENSKQNIEIAKKYNNVFASVGIHPSEIQPTVHPRSAQNGLEELVKLNNVIAVGEIGLDEKIENISLYDQEKYLDYWIDIAVKNKLPIIFHARGKKSINIIIENILKRINQGQKVRGVFHCFTGNVKQARRINKLGLYIGLTNIVCNCNDYDKLVKEIDINYLLCETDAPFIVPKIVTRKYSLPFDVKHVYQKIAEIKNFKLKEVQETIYQNCQKLFNLEL